MTIDPDTKHAVGYVGQPGGFLFNLLNPEEHSNGNHQLSLHDMCQALGHTNRFNGNTQSNTAWHSLRVADRAANLARLAGWSKEYCLHIYKLGLIHDLHEALTGDISRPMKAACPAIKEVEARVEAWLHAELGFTNEQGNPYVRKADMEIGMLEYEQFVVRLIPATEFSSSADWYELLSQLTQQNISFRGLDTGSAQG